MYMRKLFIPLLLTITAVLAACNNSTVAIPIPELPEKKPDELIAKLPAPEPPDIFSCDRDERSKLIANKPYSQYKTMYIKEKYRWGGKISAAGKVVIEPKSTMNGDDQVIFLLEKPTDGDATAALFFKNQTVEYSTGEKTFVGLGVKKGNSLDTTAEVSMETRRKILESAKNGAVLKLTFYFGPNEYEFGLPDNYADACRIEG